MGKNCNPYVLFTVQTATTATEKVVLKQYPDYDSVESALKAAASRVIVPVLQGQPVELCVSRKCDECGSEGVISRWMIGQDVLQRIIDANPENSRQECIDWMVHQVVDEVLNKVTNQRVQVIRIGSMADLRKALEFLTR